MVTLWGQQESIGLLGLIPGSQWKEMSPASYSSASVKHCWELHEFILPKHVLFQKSLPSARRCLQRNRGQGVTGNGKGKRRVQIALARKEQVVHIPVNRKLTDSGRPGGTNTSTE